MGTRLHFSCNPCSNKTALCAVIASDCLSWFDAGSKRYDKHCPYKPAPQHALAVSLHIVLGDPSKGLQMAPVLVRVGNRA